MLPRALLSCVGDMMGYLKCLCGCNMRVVQQSLENALAQQTDSARLVEASMSLPVVDVIYVHCSALHIYKIVV